MTIKTHEFAAHTAFLDTSSGVGLLVLPDPAQDVAARGPRETVKVESRGKVREVITNARSMHAEDWDDAVRWLRSEWACTPVEDDERDDVLVHGWTSDGREVIALSQQAGAEAETWPELEASLDTLDAAAGVARRA